METLKKYLNRIFLDGLSGMATGLFSTLIVGTIIQQIGTLIGGNIGDLIYLIGKMAAAVTGAGIGVGVACRFKEAPLVILSAATAGMVGGFARTDYSRFFLKRSRSRRVIRPRGTAGRFYRRLYRH